MSSNAIEAGVFSYLVKPFRETDVIPAVRAAVARHAELLRAQRSVGETPVKAIFMSLPSQSGHAWDVRVAQKEDGTLGRARSRELGALQRRPDASAAARTSGGAQRPGVRGGGRGAARHHLAGRAHLRAALGRGREAVAREDRLPSPTRARLRPARAARAPTATRRAGACRRARRAARPVAFATKGTVRDARGFASRT